MNVWNLRRIKFWVDLKSHKFSNLDQTFNLRVSLTISLIKCTCKLLASLQLDYSPCGLVALSLVICSKNNSKDLGYLYNILTQVIATLGCLGLHTSPPRYEIVMDAVQETEIN